MKDKDVEIVRLKSLLEEEKKKSADQMSVLSADNLSLKEQVVDLETVVKQKDAGMELVGNRAEYLKSALDDANAACRDAKVLISSLSAERDGLASEVCEPLPSPSFFYYFHRLLSVSPSMSLKRRLRLSMKSRPWSFIPASGSWKRMCLIFLEGWKESSI